MTEPFSRRLWSLWKKAARALGVFQTRLILGVFYWILLPPFALAARLSRPSRDPRPDGKTGWRPRATRDKTLEDLRRQS
ncbi:MAG: hypothetical protein ACT4O3_07155 [Elusimicrobiota bacterium]